MAREQKFITQLNDFGHKLRFKLREPDGTVYDIPDGATVTFEAYPEDGSSLTIDDTANVTVEDADNGIAYYTTQNGDISTAGTYWCRMKVNNITSHEAKWIVRAEYPSGE